MGKIQRFYIFIFRYLNLGYLERLPRKLRLRTELQTQAKTFTALTFKIVSKHQRLRLRYQVFVVCLFVSVPRSLFMPYLSWGVELRFCGDGEGGGRRPGWRAQLTPPHPGRLLGSSDPEIPRS